MLSKILRVGAGIELVAAVALAAVLVHYGASPWLAIAVAAMLPLAVHGVPLAIEFATGALVDRRPVARLGPIALARTWWGETWRSFKVFNVDQPWRAGFPEPTVVNDPSRPAALLIHGYMCNRATWRPWLIDHGLAQRWNCATVNLEPVFGAVDRYRELIHAAVERLRAASGAERVTLVCHSMGGLAARAYLRAHGHHAVARVVTIDTPHHGTLFARLGHGDNSRQMQLACDYVLRLARSDEPVEFVCFASQHDNLVVPRDNQILACAEAVWFERIGHLAMTDNDQVLKKLIEVVERPLPEASAPATRDAHAVTSS
jgi:predicted alpha/beta hydrolase family esterase